ncbi:hypothetical protein AABM38_02520 [Heyndrickxia sp. MSNUG]|uniref:hypothetical protein n=1 Tax=Heyndrickxia sp. MSNUG TaxID=3136677 RepID=UPI003C2B53B2
MMKQFKALMVDYGHRNFFWNRMATDLKTSTLSETVNKEITLEDLPETLPTISKEQARGRIIVKIY